MANPRQSVILAHDFVSTSWPYPPGASHFGLNTVLRATRSLVGFVDERDRSRFIETPIGDFEVGAARRVFD